MKKADLISRLGVPTLAGVSAAFLAVLLGPAHPTQAALVEDGHGPQLLIGSDDDRQDNATIRQARRRTSH